MLFKRTERAKYGLILEEEDFYWRVIIEEFWEECLSLACT
jgi:hypothetical protein